MPLTSAGFTALRSADFVTLIVDDIKAQLTAAGLSSDVDFDHDIVWSFLVLAVARQLGDLAEAQQALYDSFNRSNAAGIALDSLGELVGVPRLPATYSQATASLDGTAGVIVLAGKLVQDAVTGARWTVTADTTLPGDVVIRAEDAGAVTLAPATLQIATPVAGWTSATTAAPATVGRDLESDSDYRIRQGQSLTIAAGGTPPSLRAQILADVEGITAVVVLDNTTESTVIIGGLSLSPHSIAVVVWPDALADDQKAQIGRLIYNNVRAGIAMMGAIEVDITDTGDGVTKAVFFDYATETAFTVALELTIDPTLTTEADCTAAAEAAVVAFGASLTVGGAARRLRLEALLAEITGLLAIQNDFFNGSSADIVPASNVILAPGVPTVSYP